MTTIEEKKKFALEAIKPYYKNPKLCGTDCGQCLYITEDGKMCVAGKFIKPEQRHQCNSLGSIECILTLTLQRDLFISEAVDVLSNREWSFLQRIHDNIAMEAGVETISSTIEELGLFTYEELIS